MLNCPECEQRIVRGASRCPHCGKVFSAPLERTATEMSVMGPMGMGGASIVARGAVDPFDIQRKISMAGLADVPPENAAEIAGGWWRYSQRT